MADPNTSASGGYLAPSNAGQGPLEGQALRRFFQQFVVGITGMPGELVRPVAQGEPPNIPDAGTSWCALAIRGRPADAFPAVQHVVDQASPDGFDRLFNNEVIGLLASFYDLGTDGQADVYATLLRDGLQIAQNLEVLTLANMGLHEVGDLVDVPVLVKDRWLYRIDLPFSVARQVVRDYRVESVVSAQGTLVTDAGIVLDITAAAPQEP